MNTPQDLPNYREDLLISQLTVDDQYQRPLTANMVKQIVGSYNPRQFGVVIVNLREDGTCAVLDGQHRLAAAKQMGWTEIPCLVHEGLSLQEEAELFVRLNQDRRQPNAWDKFNARLTAEDPVALDIRDICAEVNYGIGPFPSSSNIQAVGALLEAYEITLAESPDAKGMALRWALRAWQCWQPDEAPLGTYIRALAIMYRQREGRLDLRRFQTHVAVRDHTLYSRQAKVDSQGASGSANGTIYWLARRMLIAYDKRRKPRTQTTIIQETS